jgi:hypothetical protein
MRCKSSPQVRDGFHDSPSDVVPHAGVVYEDSDGNHLSKKHVAENLEEQAMVSTAHR